MSCSAPKAVLRSPPTGPRCTKGRLVRGSAGRLRKVPRARSRVRTSDARRRAARVRVASSIYPLAVTSVGLIGGGKMGSALLGGLLDAGWDADDLAVAEVDAERRRELEQQFPKVRVVPSPAWAVADADVVVVAVKPGDVAASLQAAETSLRSETLVVSIAAGVTHRDAWKRSFRAGRSCARCRTLPRSSGWARRRSRPDATRRNSTSTSRRGCSARSGSSCASASPRSMR